MVAPLVVMHERFGTGAEEAPGPEEPRDTLRVVIACRQLLVGQALAVGLTSLGDIQVTVLHPEDSSLAVWGREGAADIVLIALEDRPAPLIAMLHRALPASTRLVVMAEQVDLVSIAECVGEGASGYLTADATVEEIGSALRKIVAGQMILPWLRAASELAIDLTGPTPSVVPGTRPGQEQLTPREQEVLRRLTLGRSTVEIAEELQISINTTRSHVQHLLKKLQLHSRLELTAYAVQNRLAR